MCGNEPARYWPIVERDPSVPVFVDMAGALGAKIGQRADAPSLGVRAYGLQARAEVAGVLVQWVRTADGAWLGVCELELSSANDRARVRVRQLVPAVYIARR